MALVCLGCGPEGFERVDPDDVDPPARAGSEEELAGTTWRMSDGRTLVFGENGQGQAMRGQAPPMPMNYTLRDNGVIAVVVCQGTEAGTWNGDELVLGGQTLEQVE
jgi:hypothetical protein